jgi:probable HAF family extracellular repeat protein
VRDLDGDYTRIDVPDAPLTFSYGINNRGQVVGFYLDADLVRHGFLFEDGAITTFDHPLASADTQSHDLNARGEIVGLYERPASDAKLEALAAAAANGTPPGMLERWGPGGATDPPGSR